MLHRVVRNVLAAPRGVLAAAYTQMQHVALSCKTSELEVRERKRKGLGTRD
jgi:hypothetical protein